MPKAVVLAAGEIWEDMNKNMLKQERIFRISGNNKGLTCPFKGILCQDESSCPVCPIYLDWLRLREKVVICGSCGKVMYRISDFGRSVLFLGLCDECAKKRGSEKGEA